MVSRVRGDDDFDSAIASRAYVNETANRALSTTYTNNEPVPIDVIIRVQGSATSLVASFFVAGAVVGNFTITGSNQVGTFTATVPVGNQVRVTTNAGHTLVSWFELK